MGRTILLLMILPSSLLGWHLAYLPVPMALLFLFSLGVIWLLSAIAVLVPDLTQVVNLTLIMAMFLSPIGFSMDQVPPGAALLLYFNPLTYLIESFRFALVGIRSTPLWLDALFLFGSLISSCVGGTVFRRLMPLFSDHE